MEIQCDICNKIIASTEEPYRFEENKASNLRVEIDGNLTNNNQKEEQPSEAFTAFTPFTAFSAKVRHK